MTSTTTPIDVAPWTDNKVLVAVLVIVVIFVVVVVLVVFVVVHPFGVALPGAQEV